jgi:hypothetical protein
MQPRYVTTVISTYSVLSWISAFVCFILALALTFLSPFAITFFIEQNPAAVPQQFSTMAFQQLATGVAVMSGVIVFMFAAFFLALGVGLWRRTPWARYLVLIPSVVWLFSFPIGTAVGLFGIYAFAFDKEVRAQFGVMTPAATVARVSAKKKR